MPKRNIDVFDRSGAKLFSYCIALEEEGCLDTEFEEVALIFAESSGLVPPDEVVHLRACCDSRTAMESTAEDAAATLHEARKKNAVVSLVKHRMKRAVSGACLQGVRYVS